jgi:hypothetical protein
VDVLDLLLLKAFSCGCSGLVLCNYLDQIWLICYGLHVMIAWIRTEWHNI